MLGRRGPAQAAFTNPELLELGEMTDADVFVDPRRRRARPALEGVHRERGRAHHPEEERGDPDRLRRAASRSGKRRRIVLRFLVSPVEILGDRPRRGHPHRPQRAGGGRRRLAARPAHRHHRGARLRARVPLDRLPAAPASTACRSTSGAARSRTSGGAHRAAARGEYAVGWIKRGPDRDHRHEQARRPGDRGRAAGGPRRRPAARRPPTPTATRSRRSSPSASPTR